MSIDFQTTDIDPSLIFLKKISDLEDMCIQLQVMAQSELNNAQGMPKINVLIHHNVLRRFYSRLKPVLHDEKEEPIIDRMFEKSEPIKKKLKMSKNPRTERKRAELLFVESLKIFDTLLEFMNRHDLSFKGSI